MGRQEVYQSIRSRVDNTVNRTTRNNPAVIASSKLRIKTFSSSKPHLLPQTPVELDDADTKPISFGHLASDHTAGSRKPQAHKLVDQINSEATHIISVDTTHKNHSSEDVGFCGSESLDESDHQPDPAFTLQYVQPQETSFTRTVKRITATPSKTERDARSSRPRIRFRQHIKTDASEINTSTLPINNFRSPEITSDTILKIRDQAWQPTLAITGRNVASFHVDSICNFKTAWEVGKKGCIAFMKERRESFIKGFRREKLMPKLLVMDGTDPLLFLTCYDLSAKSAISSTRSGVYRAADFLNATWHPLHGNIATDFYERKSNDGWRHRRVEFRAIPWAFFEAMISCLRELTVSMKIAEIFRMGRNKANSIAMDMEEKIDERRRRRQSEAFEMDSVLASSTGAGSVPNRRQSLSEFRIMAKRSRSKFNVAPKLDQPQTIWRSNKPY